MSKILLQDDIVLVESKIKQFEEATGCELLIVISDAADPYPAASWRFGVISSFIICFIFSYYFEFHHSYIYPVVFLLFTLFMVWVGHFKWAKRLALSEWEMAREGKEKAIEFFHTLGASKVSHKVTAMIMLSLLERKIQILVDDKLKTQLDQPELDHLIHVMQDHFKKGNIGLGLVQSIQNLEDKIHQKFQGKVSDVPPSELKDTIHFVTI